jgi:hypothetical protein
MTIIRKNTPALELCMEKWIHSKDSALLVLKEFSRLIETNSGVFRDVIYAMILFDTANPIVSKYIKEKSIGK